MVGFDKTKFKLGKLCAHAHDYEGMGQSLQYRNHPHCVECAKARTKSRRTSKAPVVHLALSSILALGRIQPRVTLSQETIDDYEAVYVSTPEAMPPLDVFGREQEYILADGFHRYCAAKQAQVDTLPCIVHAGSDHDALHFAIHANQQHGLRYSNADKRHIVNRLLDMDPGSGLSANEQAKIAGVSQPFVSQIIAERDNTMTKAQAARHAQRVVPKRPRSSLPVDLSFPSQERPQLTRADPNRMAYVGRKPGSTSEPVCEDDVILPMSQERTDRIDQAVAAMVVDHVKDKQPIRTACPMCDHSFETSEYALTPADRTPESTTEGEALDLPTVDG